MAHALETIRAQYRNLSEADQLAVIVDLVQGGHGELRRSDDFIDALWETDKALTADYRALASAAEPMGEAA